MASKQRRYCSIFSKSWSRRNSCLGKNRVLPEHWHMPGVFSQRMRLVACTLLILAIALNLALAGRGAQVASRAAFTPQSTSLNSQGNVFLTATLIGNTATANGSAASVATADFNGDGKPDFVVTSAGCNTCGLSVFLGKGDGTFQTPKLTANLGGAYYVVTGDFNGDGKQDLAVLGYVPTNLTSPGLFILLGNGDGTFTLKTTLTGFTNPQSIAVGDFNGDSKLDIAMVDQGSNSVSIFLGIGDGNFQASISTSILGTGAAKYAAAADFNKDGHLDLVISDQDSNHVVVLLGNGNGNFQGARNFSLAAGTGGFDVAVGDFNGDGNIDIAATTQLSDTVDILLGKGDGNFQPAVSFNAGMPGGGTANLAVGDFNKDGNLDVITSIDGSFNGGSSVSVLFGKGDGTFSAPLLLAANHSPGQLALADFNADGNLDWVAADMTQTSLTLGLGNGNGTFQTGVNYAAGATPQVAVGDLNNDGKLDLVTVDSDTGDIGVLLGKGDGTFQPAIKTAVSGAFGGIAVADLNGDGNLDVVVTDSTGLPPRNVIVLLGNGDGTFAAPSRIPTGGSSEGQMVVADFNADGKLDIAVVNQADNTVSLLLGNGNGTFQAPKITSALASDGFLGYLAAADLNGDGKLDLVVPDYMGSASGQVAILLGKGDGSFQAPSFLTSGAGSTGLAIADLNKDGKLDLVVANQFGTVNIFLGNGNGTFNTPIVLADNTQLMAGVCCANPIPIVVAVGDFNLDGNLDLMIGAARSNNGSVANFVSEVNFGSQLFLGNGDGTFAAPQDYLVGAETNSLAVGDFNGDGAPDVAAGDAGENFVSILLNQTPPPVSVSPKSLTFGNQLVGTASTTKPVMIKNNGAAATTIIVSASGDFSQTNDCPVSPATLALGTNCIINVTFNPTATGTRTGAITISHHLAGSPQAVTITGTGVAPILTLGETRIPFGNQPVGTSSIVQMASLANTGTAALTISSIAITGANIGDFSQTNTCPASPATLATGANCTISVTFRPTATGPRAASVTITDGAAGSPQSVSLMGTGTAPVVMLSATSLNFSGQLVTTASVAQDVTVTNNGTAVLTISSIAVTGANNGDFSETNTCPVGPATLTAAAKCTISLTFKPTATGNRAANVTITDDATGSPQDATLTGTGTDFSIDVAPGGSSSATVTAGQTATYNLQITPANGFNGTVTLACSGSPSEAICTNSSASVTPNGGNPATFTTMVSTTGPSMILPRAGPHNLLPFTGVRLILLLFTALVLRVLLARSKVAAAVRGRSLGGVSAVALVLLVLAWAGACGGGGGGGGPHDPGTPKGPHTLTVTGTSGGVSRTLNLTLTVN